MKEYNPTIVRNSTSYLLRRPRTTPVDIGALHCCCTTTSECTMMMYLDRINYGMPGDPSICPSVADAVYPSHPPLASGYHVIMQYPDWCSDKHARYKLVLIYRDRYDNIRLHDCDPSRWYTASTMLKHLSELLERVNKNGRD